MLLLATWPFPYGPCPHLTCSCPSGPRLPGAHGAARPRKTYLVPGARPHTSKVAEASEASVVHPAEGGSEARR